MSWYGINAEHFGWSTHHVTGIDNVEWFLRNMILQLWHIVTRNLIAVTSCWKREHVTSHPVEIAFKILWSSLFDTLWKCLCSLLLILYITKRQEESHCLIYWNSMISKQLWRFVCPSQVCHNSYTYIKAELCTLTQNTI